jgi:GNAT superfamily N-acetyltransferase
MFRAVWFGVSGDLFASDAGNSEWWSNVGGVPVYGAGVTIRETTIADLTAIDRVTQAVEPWHVTTVASQELLFDVNPPAARMLRVCAQFDTGADLVGFGWTKLDLYAHEPGTAILTLAVHPTAQRRGIATALHDRLIAHLRDIGARKVLVELVDQRQSTAFAEKRRYVLGATNRYIVVDPRTVPVASPVAGVTVMCAREAGPEPFYQVIDVSARDEPGEVAFAGMPYGQWLEQFWQTIDYDVSMVAFVDGKPTCTTELKVNYATGRATSAGTDTLPEFRGQGLATLVKAVSLRAAAGRGITAAFTSNDEVNVPMRAINARLGYEYVGSVRIGVRTPV